MKCASGVLCSLALSFGRIRYFSGCLQSFRDKIGRVSVCKKKSEIERHEKLWRDPSKCWDKSGKTSARFPDLNHKETGEERWLVDRWNSPRMASDISSRALGQGYFSRTKLLSRFNKAQQYDKTLEFFHQMLNEGSRLDGYVFVPILNACAALHVLEEGRRIHKLVLETGCQSDAYVGSSLVDMYAKCGSVDEAWNVFNKMPIRDVVAWTAMIVGYANCGEGVKALELFQQMLEQGFQPNSFTYAGSLNACASTGALEDGRRIHEQITQNGYVSNIYVGSSLVDMYAKCGCVDEAWRVFSRMPTRDVVGWNALIQGCVKCGEGQKALELFQKLVESGTEPNEVTFAGLLNACASLAALEDGKRVHEWIIHSGWESNINVGSSLVDMYANCGRIDEAWKAFNKIAAPNIVAWTAIILGFVKCGQSLRALDLYKDMQLQGIKPDSVTFVGLLSACASLGSLEEGKRVHDQIIQNGDEENVNVGNSLVDMSSKCGSMHDAGQVFNRMPTHDLIL